MLLQSDTAEVVSSRKFESETYRLDLNRHSARILSQDIYSYPQLAAIREVLSNAADSHIHAGCPDKPFRVHLPTDSEPFFRVADEGVGLSIDEAPELFGGYFSSRTRFSREGTGCFGLGAKAPHAYAAQFNVIATKHGETGAFTCQMNAEGIPEIVLIRRQPTDAPDGVTVEFAVANEDIPGFVADALSALNAFDSPFTLASDEHQATLDMLAHTLREHMIVDKPEWALLHESWARQSGMARLSTHIDEASVIIPVIGGHPTTDKPNLLIMGNVAYPLDIKEALRASGGAFAGDDAGIIREMRGVVLRLDIRKHPVEMHPSRERLNYTEGTGRVIVERLRTLLAELRALHADAGEVATPWQRMAYANDSLGGYPHWAQTAVGAPSLSFVPFSERLKDMLTRLDASLFVHDLDPTRSDPIDDGRARRKRLDWRTSTRYKKCVVRPTRHMLVVLQDTARNAARAASAEALARCKRAGISDNVNFLMVRPGVNPAERERFEAQTLDLMAALGNPDYVLASELVKRHKVAIKRPKARSGGILQRITAYRLNGAQFESLAWDALDEGERRALIEGERRAAFVGTLRGEIQPLDGDDEALVDALCGGTALAHGLDALAPDTTLLAIRPSDATVMKRFADAHLAGQRLRKAIEDADPALLRRIISRALPPARSAFRKAELRAHWLDYAVAGFAKNWNRILNAYVERWGRDSFPGRMGDAVRDNARTARFFSGRHRTAERCKIREGLGLVSLALAKNPQAFPDALQSPLTRYTERLSALYAAPSEAVEAALPGLNIGAFHSLVFSCDDETLLTQLRISYLAQDLL